MRNTKELLELMLAHQKLFRLGLCLWVNSLCYKNLITCDELDLLHDYIKSNKPKDAGCPHYWKMGEIAPRIKWINQQIEKL